MSARTELLPCLLRPAHLGCPDPRRSMAGFLPCWPSAGLCSADPPERAWNRSATWLPRGTLPTRVDLCQETLLRVFVSGDEAVDFLSVGVLLNSRRRSQCSGLRSRAWTMPARPCRRHQAVGAAADFGIKDRALRMAGGTVASDSVRIWLLACRNVFFFFSLRPTPRLPVLHRKSHQRFRIAMTPAGVQARGRALGGR